MGTVYSAMGPGLIVTGDASWSWKDHLMALLRRIGLGCMDEGKFQQQSEQSTMPGKKTAMVQ